MLKTLSMIGYLAMAGGLIVLLVTRNVLSPSPLVIVPQVAAAALMIWARITLDAAVIIWPRTPRLEGLSPRDHIVSSDIPFTRVFASLSQLGLRRIFRGRP